MTQIKSSFYYDPKFDDLTIRLQDYEDVYSEEIYNNIYIYYSEKDDSVVGAQILYLSKRSNTTLKEYLPEEIYNLVVDLRKGKE